MDSKSTKLLKLNHCACTPSLDLWTDPETCQQDVRENNPRNIYINVDNWRRRSRFRADWNSRQTPACPSPSLHFFGENNSPLASVFPFCRFSPLAEFVPPLDSCHPHPRSHFSYLSFDPISAPYRNSDWPFLCCIAFSAVLGPSFSCSLFLTSLGLVSLLSEVLLPLYCVTVAVAVAVVVLWRR